MPQDEFNEKVDIENPNFIVKWFIEIEEPLMELFVEVSEEWQTRRWFLWIFKKLLFFFGVTIVLT